MVRIVGETVSWSGDNEDRETRFVKQRCAVYLLRVLESKFKIDEEDLEMATWVLGPQASSMVDFLLPLLKGRKADELTEQLKEAIDCPDDITGAVIKTLKEQYRALSRSFSRHLLKTLENFIRIPLRGRMCDLEKNLQKFQKMFNLSDIESEVCLTFYFTNAYKQARHYFETHLDIDQFSGRNNFRTVLGISQSNLNKVIQGKLQEIGILLPVGSYVQFDDYFLEILLDPSMDIDANDLFRSIPPEQVPLGYHLISSEIVTHLIALLGRKPTSSTHILLYGAPGTGKTSFARALIKKLEAPGFEIQKCSKEDASHSRAAITSCLNITNSGESSVILVDEADNTLNTTNAWSLRGETLDKGWLNQLMETPGRRMVWIVNSIEGMEESVKRRFAFTHQFKPFNRRQRTLLWDRVLRRNRIKRFFSEDDIKSLATRYKVSTGVMDMAARKTKESVAADRLAVHQFIRISLEAHESIMNGGHPVLEKRPLEHNYSTDGLNVGADLPGLMERLTSWDCLLRENERERVPAVSLLFHGPPGTGKSELARYIANHLDRELMVKRASDILDPYVGMTERKMAAAFEEASREEVVLVIDEVDTFLFSRERASRSWEVSFTNEFLTRMERFRGILVCTTNRIADLDPASLRRFSDKIAFEYLTDDGKLLFYRQFLAPLVSGPFRQKEIGVLVAIEDLTPGDFKVVRDRHAFVPPDHLSHKRLVRGLEEESQVKRLQYGRTIKGF